MTHPKALLALYKDAYILHTQLEWEHNHGLFYYFNNRLAPPKDLKTSVYIIPEKSQFHGKTPVTGIPISNPMRQTILNKKENTYLIF